MHFTNSDFFPGAVGDGVAAFVEFDVVDEGLNRFAGKAAFLDALGEDVAAFVAPAELGDEAVPNVAFFIGRGVPCECAQVKTTSSGSPASVRVLISE